MKRRTVVEVMLPRINAEGVPVNKDNKPWSAGIKDWEQAMDPVLFYLLHWGLEYTVMYDGNNQPYGVNYTIGICQEMETGIIRTFVPSMIKVIGVEVK